ncbi:neutral alpha-glucosidase ab [Stylonychia lemnae]|uniref:Glucosidase II subunit alpha n=1 Tax=Stylonychia lemnae TaxID=5949 RepID=A0A078B560_STYLE|nr:neutral alpha-glucosidase ab [Stylonychia lemnae]|eukprot:CDW88377.1 neutral alpha-glucosidase ab [Stylonychia lemnae]
MNNLNKIADFQQDQVSIKYKSKDMLDSYEYIIRYKPFRVIQKINDITTIIVNDKDTLLFENYQINYDILQDEFEPEDDCLNDLLSELGFNKLAQNFGAYDTQDDMWLSKYMYEQIMMENLKTYPRESFMIGFSLNSEYLFGLPERSQKFLLKTTEETDPYRLFNSDIFPHKEWSDKGLYSSIPYIQGHHEDYDLAILYYNSAETWVDIIKKDALPQVNESNYSQRYVNFISESGVLEFFIIGSASKDKTQSPPKRVANLLARISGFQFLPPLFSLGFHYSKWESDISARWVIDLSNNFDEGKIPVDVFWMDITHTEGGKYFTFDPERFNDQDFDEMKQIVSQKGRKIVVITDPHIKKDDEYWIYKQGYDIDILEQDEGFPLKNIFIKDSTFNPYHGYCWPGDSSWIDFFNPYARKFWSKQYDYENFKKTNNMFHIWIDMNEPSVFNNNGDDEGTMSKINLHLLDNGVKVYHRDVHNAYGLMMSQATYEGLLQRDQNQQRPFILTRASFFGTQKYSAKWTGDNRSKLSELGVSVSQLLSLSISGVHFVGPDVPGFAGDPNSELFIMFYQLAGWYPFFRAHGHLDAHDREPFKQEEKVKNAIKRAVYTRYSLIHYFYTTFYQSHTQGYPVMRPIWFNFPSQSSHFNNQHQFMIGDSFLIVPKLQYHEKDKEVNDEESQNEQEKYYILNYTLPKDNIWYNYETKKSTKGDSIQRQALLSESQTLVFVKGGSIIPIKLHPRQSSLARLWLNDIRLEVYLDEQGNASGFLYLDDGESFKYQTNSEYLYVKYIFEKDKIRLEILRDKLNFSDQENKKIYPPAFQLKITDILIFAHGNQPVRKTVNKYVISELDLN